MHAVGRQPGAGDRGQSFRDALGLLRAGRGRLRPGADKIASGVLGRAAAAVLGVPFVYWMSFPMVEGFEERRDEIGSAGRGLALGGACAARPRRAHGCYRLVLPGARHVFVQSAAMAAGWRCRASPGRA